MNKKRVELSVQTNMGYTEVVNTAADYIKAAMEDRQPAIAVTDVKNVYAFPAAFEYADKKDGIKLIYGCELSYGCAPYETGHLFYILAKNKQGLKELYKLLTEAIEFFSLEEIDRENLVLGISIRDELMQKITDGADDDELESIIKRFDYVLLNPTEYFSEYAEINGEERAREVTRRVISVCEKNNVLPVASAEARFLSPDDAECRKILFDYEGVENFDEPNMCFRTTDEMLAEFEYLGKEKAYEVVVTNSNIIADMIDDTFAPFDTDAEYPNEIETVRKNTYDAAYKKYGNPLPEPVKTRIESELRVIGGNNKSAMKFILAEKIAEDANEKGYSIGTCSSVGSSLVANLLGITDVNPLEAHYFCENCKYIEFHPEENCGVDLTDRICPQCGKKLSKGGYTLPEETYTKCDPNRELSMDIILPPEFSWDARDVLRKNANGEILDFSKKWGCWYADRIVNEYASKKKLKLSDSRRAEYEKKISRCAWAEPTVGPGVFIFPSDKEITDYTPVDYLYTKQDETLLEITHFDYDKLYNKLLKIDTLCTYDLFSMLHELEKATGIKANRIPLDDKETMDLIINGDTDGIPEFEDDDAKKIIGGIHRKFDDLIRAVGICHGSGTWEDNGKDLYEKGTKFSDLIACRDDVIQTLVKYGVDRGKAFLISDKCWRKLTDEQYNELLESGVPEWFLTSFNEIEYLFPRAHIAEYVRVSFIAAYYKTHFRTEFEKIAGEYKRRKAKNE